MKKTLLLLLLFIFNLISAQETEIDSLVSQEINSLQKENIEEFFIVEEYCSGCVKILRENCNYGTSILYVFWKDKSTSFFRKIDKCNSEKTEISDEILSNYSEKIDKIYGEEVKPYQTGKNSFISVSHSEFTKVYFVIDGKLKSKNFNHFDITSEDEKPNLNFKHNNSQEIVKLAKACERVTLRKK